MKSNEDLRNLIAQGSGLPSSVCMSFTVDEETVELVRTLLCTGHSDPLLKTFNLISESRGRILELLEVVSKYSTFEELVIFNTNPQDSALDFQDVLPAIGHALSASQTIWSFQLFTKHDISERTTQDSWDEFVHGLHRCQSLDSISLGIPGPANLERMRQLTQAMLTKPDDESEIKGATKAREWVEFAYIIRPNRTTLPPQQHVIHPLEQLMRTTTCVQQIYFRARMELTSETMSLLIDFCCNTTHLENLKISSCKITAEDLIKFFKRLPEMKSLRTINLDETAYPPDTQEREISNIYNTILNSFIGSDTQAGNMTLTKLDLGDVVGTEKMRKIAFYPNLNRQVQRHRLHSMSTDEWCRTLADSDRCEVDGTSFVFYILRHDPDRWCRSER